MIASLFALALAQSTPELETSEAAVALAACAVPKAQMAASGPETASAIADAALNACTEPQARVRSVLTRIGGEAAADTGMQVVIAHFRTRLMRVVDARRGLASRPDTPATAWGDCVRASAAELAAHTGDVEALAAEAMRHCANEEASVRAGLLRGRDAGNADALMAPILAAVHSVAVQGIQQARANIHRRR